MSRLFCGKPLAFGRDLFAKVRDHVASIPEDALLDTAVPAAVADVVESLAAQELAIRWDQMYSTGARESSITVSGWDEPATLPATQITIRIPFEGEGDLFFVHPSSWTTVQPEADVDQQRRELVLQLTDHQPTGDRVRNFVDSARKLIEQYVGWANNDVRKQRAELENYAAAEVAARRGRLLHARGVEAALGIPVRPVTSKPTYPLPVRPTRLRVTDTPAKGRFQPEPAIELELYEDILQLVDNFRATLERTPRTFAKLSEEELRDHLLLILNSNYAGAASGEVFNGNGKTDILLRHDDRNVFIAECKFWRGVKGFSDAVDQLLRYLVWRDSKAALILFIRNKNATELIDKAVSAMQAHPQYVSGGGGTARERRSDFIMASTQDAGRTLRVALLPVVVPSIAAEKP